VKEDERMAQYECKLRSAYRGSVGELVKADTLEAAVRKAAKKIGYSQAAIDRGYTVQREGESQWGITMHDGDTIRLVELAENE
jgi:hypothetical protein